MQYNGRWIGKIKVHTIPYPPVEGGSTPSQGILLLVVACRDYIDQAAIGKVDRDCDIVQRELGCAVHDRGLLAALGVGREPEEYWTNVGIFTHHRGIVTVVYRLDTIRVHSARVNLLLEAAPTGRRRNVPGSVGADGSKFAIG